MHRKLSILTICLTALVAGLLPATAGARAAGVRTTIRVIKPDVVLGGTVRVTGRVIASGTPIPGALVTVTAKDFPYRSKPAGVRTVRTNAAGVYSARVRPRFNTRYRAVSGTLAGFSFSRVAPAYVTLTPVKPRLTLRGHRAIVSFARRFPAGYPIRLGGHRVSWYFRKASNPIYRRVATSATREPKANVLYARVSFMVPRLRRSYRFFVTGCYGLTRVGGDDGFGRTRTRRCPARFRSSSARVVPGGSPMTPAAVGLSVPSLSR